MAATLLLRRGLWLATHRVGFEVHAYASPDRQDAARELYARSGVWLGTGCAPASSLDQALADYAEVAHDAR